jgi:hypothetical protein
MWSETATSNPPPNGSAEWAERWIIGYTKRMQEKMYEVKQKT